MIARAFSNLVLSLFCQVSLMPGRPEEAHTRASSADDNAVVPTMNPATANVAGADGDGAAAQPAPGVHDEMPLERLEHQLEVEVRQRRDIEQRLRECEAVGILRTIQGQERVLIGTRMKQEGIQLQREGEAAGSAADGLRHLARRSDETISNLRALIEIALQEQNNNNDV
eukprot:jgi/Mesen1/8589/ME000005S08551